MSTAIKWFLRLVTLVFACVLLAAAVAGYFVYQLVRPGNPDDATPKTYTLQKNTSASDIADDLESRHFIHNALAFRVLLRVTHNGARLQAGNHMLNGSMTSVDVMNELVKITQLPGVKVTIPEGKTLEQLATIVEKHTGIARADLLAIAHNPRLRFPKRTWLPENSMEGYLFPDTYSIQKNGQAGDVLDMMLSRFEETAMPELGGKAPQDLTLHQAVTLASLVEAEAQVAAERPKIASVYYNRLKQGMPLQCDATVQYALGEHHAVVTLEDLKIDSPYNTYLHAGLPPGPICNPGLDAMRAVMHPAQTQFLYYVRNDKKNDGSHVFSKTYAEHQKNITAYQKR
jgi:UPF0755 protein